MKRFKREGQQAYSYEVTEIEKLEGTYEAETSQLPRTTNFSIDAAKLANNFGSRKENGENNSENPQGANNVRYNVSTKVDENINFADIAQSQSLGTVLRLIPSLHINH